MTIPKNPPSPTVTPSGSSPSGDGFFGKASAEPTPDAHPVPAGGALPVVDAPAPDLPPPAPAPPSDGRKTPEEWALELGHVDPGLVPDPQDPKMFGVVLPKVRTGNSTDMRSWMFRAAKQREGWGTTKAIDVRLTREEYLAAVDGAIGISVGGEGKFAQAEREKLVQLAAEQAAKARAAAGEAALDEAIKAGRILPAQRQGLLERARERGAEWVNETADTLALVGGGAAGKRGDGSRGGDGR
jgi:hypothetical protein